MSVVDENRLLDYKTRLESYLAKLNTEQREAAEAPITQNTQVLAGAGTGKTYMMTVRAMVLILTLMAEGHPAPTEALWIATFTERAAGELRERLEAMYQDIVGQALPKAMWIGTFHSLSNRLLADFTGTSTETHILQDLDLLIIQKS